LILFSVFVLTAPAMAEYLVDAMDMSVSEIDNLAVKSNFDAVTGVLSWSRGGIATMFYDTGSTPYRVNVTGTLSGITDTSSAGLASATFSSGTFSINFYAMSDGGKTTSLGNLSGELFPGYSYHEGETAQNPSQLYGSAPMRINTFSFNGYHWSEALGEMGGLTATTTNLGGNLGNISNYQSNWTSNNTIVRLLADESGIPEPATIILLGLGGLGLLRKRSK
jgi:hypothetical protein